MQILPYFIMRQFKFPIFLIITSISGLLTVFSFAPYGIWIFQILSLAVLSSITLLSNKHRHAFVSGWCYGFFSLSAGFYWLFISLHVYGGMNALLAAIAVSLLAIFLGILPAFACLLTHVLMKRFKTGLYLSAIMLFPAFWTIFEWIRGWIVSGLPWLSVGYAFTDSPLAGYAPIIGVFGIGFIVAIIAGILVCFGFSLKENRYYQASIAAVSLSSFILAGYFLQKIEWTTPYGNTIHIRLLQGNISQETKFSPQQIKTTLTQYADMIMNKPADLIVTPETAIPIYPQYLPTGYLTQLQQFINTNDSHLAIGMPLADSKTIYTNSLIVLFPNSNQFYRYNKHHLVPFGEFIPFGFHWFVNMMHIPLGEFTRGNLIQAPFRIKDQWILPNICYEDIFGEEIAARLRDEYTSKQPMASLLLNISNIAWFGNTIALPQHLQISRMRSIETGRPMLRATNTGTTALIDKNGAVLQEINPYIKGELELNISGTQGITPYIRWGNALILTISLIFIIAACTFPKFLSKNIHG